MKRWELPGTAKAGDGEETLKLTLQGLSGAMPLDVRITHDLVVGEGDNQDQPTQGAEVAETLGRHVEAINRAFGDSPDTKPVVADGRAVVDASEFLLKYEQIQTTDEPRLSLIVRLAEAIQQHVTDVGQSPRKVLRRERRLERVARARQLDAACLRWLARQPGSSLAQRAGPRQRVLSVVRKDVVDTLENRVVRDLLDRSVQECDQYLREHYGRNGTRRYDLVQGYRKTCQALRAAGPLAQLSPAAGLVQPNYVLQHDDRYTPLWTWYLKLRRKKEEEDRIWRWKQRTIAELSQLLLHSAVNQLDQDPRGQELGFSGRLYWQSEQVAGKFLDERSELVPQTIRTRSGMRQFTVLPQSSLASWEAALDHPVQVAALAPDALGVLHPPCQLDHPQELFPIWSLLHPGGVSHEGIAPVAPDQGLPVNSVVLHVGRDADSGHERGFRGDIGLPFSFEQARDHLRDRLADALEVV